jgi:hypothetical protein
MDATEFNAYNQHHGPLVQFELPPIKTLTIKRVKFTPPKFKNIQSSLSKYKEAIEITIVTEKPIPVRAATPVLYIGKVKVSYYVPGKATNEYRFYAFEIDQLKDNDPIIWGWNNDPVVNLNQTKFSYTSKKKGK